MQKRIVAVCAVVLLLAVVAIGTTYSQQVANTISTGRLFFGDISDDGKTLVFASNCNDCPADYFDAWVVNADANTAKSTDKVKGNPIDATITGDGKKVYVAGGGAPFGKEAGSIGVYDVASGQISKINVDTAVVLGLRVTRDGKELYYVDYKSGTLFGVDTASGQKNFELALPTFAAFKVYLSQDGNTAYVAGAVRGKSVYGVRVVDLAGKKIATSIDTELSYGGSDIAETTAAVSKDGKTMVISEANDGGNKASVVDLAGGKVTATVELGSTPIGVAIAPDGKTAYVGGFEDEVVFVIDLGSNAVKGKIELKTTCGVYDLKISPDGKTLYAACQKGGGGVIKIAL